MSNLDGSCIRLGIYFGKILNINTEWTHIVDYNQIIVNLTPENISFLNNFNIYCPYSLKAVDESGVDTHLYAYMDCNNLFLKSACKPLSLDTKTVILSNVNCCSCLSLFLSYYIPPTSQTFPANVSSIVNPVAIRHFDNDIKSCLLCKTKYFNWYSVNLEDFSQTLIAQACVYYDGVNLFVTPNKTILADGGAYALENIN